MNSSNSRARPVPVVAVLLLAVAMLCIPPAFARSLVVASPVVTAAFSDSGEYQVHCLGSQWALRGKLRGKPDAVTISSGADRLGAWREVDARTGAGVAAIRVYENEPVVLFRDERTRAGANLHVFPVFETLPSGLMKLGYGVNTFARYQFGSLGGEGPWVLFDQARRTMVLAPADHFLAADMTNGPDGADAGGIDPRITPLPASFEHGTMLVLGVGIGATLDAWGQPAYAWDWVRQTGSRIPAGGSFPLIFENGWAYAVVTPVGEDGIGILGDTGKIVPLARARFPAVTNSTNAHVTIAYAAGEDAVRLTGYAARQPRVRALHGNIESMQYAAATHLFSVAVHPAAAEGGARTAELVIQEGR